MPYPYSAKVHEYLELSEELGIPIEEAKRLIKEYAPDTTEHTAKQGQNKNKTDPSHQLPPIIKVEHLSKIYKAGKSRTKAINDISFNVYPGEFIAITGPSGCGKSTLMHLLGGLDKPSSGDIIMDGHDVTKLKNSRLATFRAKTIGFVFQSFYLQPFLTLMANLEVPGMFIRTNPSVRQEKIKELAQMVGLEERLDYLPKSLSGGQLQRAAITRALLNSPKIILADEPTGNLDSKNSEKIMQLFQDIRARLGTTIILVTHDKHLSHQADRIIHIKDGAIL